MTFHTHPSPENSPTFFSLYTTGKPEKKHYIQTDTESLYPIIYKKWLNEYWYAYLQEPEFRAKQKVYEIQTSKKWYIIQIDFEEGNYHIYCHDNIKYPGKRKYKTFKESEITHFYPGQKIDPSKVSYVRKIEFEEDEGAVMANILKLVEWQPAPEPEKEIKKVKYKKDWPKIQPNPKHAQWLTDKSSGKVRAVINQEI